ncbi:MAG: hypothetical protein ACTHU0_13405 [Kofleriaceae bacterium]
MKRTFAVCLLSTVLANGGCKFAVEHPAATTGIVGGALGLSMCELASSDHTTCALAGGGAAALLAGVTALAMWLGTTGEDSILQPSPDAPVDPIRVRRAPHGPEGAIAGAPATPTAMPTPALPAGPVPAYLEKAPALQVRSDGAIVPAPAEDQAVAASYAKSPVRGPLSDGARITILTARTRYRLGEEVRVIHVLEAPTPGKDLYVMGPKEIYAEYVDGVERTGKQPTAGYDGAVVASPGADFHYEVTSYRFDKPGPHRIQWRADGRESNVIEIEVAP